MTSAKGPAAGSPLIAGAGMSTAEFHDFDDDDYDPTGLLDFSNSPDTLQTLDSMGTHDHKTFLTAQELTADPFSESPNESYHDSSSESASSSKIAHSSAPNSLPPPHGDVAMEDTNEVGMDWPQTDFAPFQEDDHAFGFGRNVDPSAVMMGNSMYGYCDNEGSSMMDRPFDFDGINSSPEAVSTGPISMPSPEMPVIKTNTPRRPKQTTQRARNPNGIHKKQTSVSIAFSANGMKSAGSRAVSPISAMVASQDSSPAAPFLNSPTPSVDNDIVPVTNGHASWPETQDVAYGHPAQGSSVPGSSVQEPPFQANTGYELRISSTPLKSRVETQIPIKMTLSPVPPGVTQIHLPTHTLAKPKLIARPTPTRSAETLELFVSLVCTSVMQHPGVKEEAMRRAAALPQGYLPEIDAENQGPLRFLRICKGCMTRERKRAARKKVKKPEEEERWIMDEERRVIVFNTSEMKKLEPITGPLDASGRPETIVSNAMQIDAPMRIACYCRHHQEKMGFQVIFTLKDYQDQVIAQAMSQPIMITDDHKTHPISQPNQQPGASDRASSATRSASSESPSQPPATEANSFSASAHNGVPQGSQALSTSTRTTPIMGTSPVPTRGKARAQSPSQAGRKAKKRKPEPSTTRVPKGLVMTRLETSPAPGPHNNAHMSSATSPFTPTSGPFPHMESMLGQNGGQQLFPNGSTTPGTTDHGAFFTRSASMDNLALAQLYSAPPSTHPSRAPSPNGLRNGVGMPHIPFAPALTGNLYTMPMNQPRSLPMIHKIIPNEGPKIGGIEVTVLGQSFFQGLEVWFGEQKATTTTFWGDASLVCLLPPSPVAGAVAVTLRSQSASGSQTFPMAKEPPIFKYIDDNEDKIIRTALSVLGHKMSGQMLDVSELARRILNEGSSAWGAAPPAGPSAGGPSYNQASHGQHLESQLLTCLDLIDLDDSSHRTRLDLSRSTGHTMLHLACSLGYHRMVAALLARGANPDARDRGGFTPLHMAAIHDQPEIARRLMINGADPTMRSLSGLTAADVAQSRPVLRAIRQSQRHVRSFSSSSFHSRASSSAASLRSLWEPLTPALAHEPDSIHSGTESPEYTSGDFEDEDPDENSSAQMRRRSRAGQSADGIDALVGDLGVERDVMSSPTTQFAAFKDQIQQQLHQFQQTMAVHLQSLAQMPALPGMPVLPDYQAYLQPPPFVRRMQQLMPGSGPRPDPQEGEASRLDSRWWDIMSYMQSHSVAPPAYEDLFGRQDLKDTKQESALRATAEAEADIKCAVIYEEQPAQVATASGTRDTTSDVLKIGRKNAITREQQEQFLLAHERKLKKLSSDRNLFFIWIPLLVSMICALLYSYFPALFPFIWTSVRALAQAGQVRVARLMQGVPGRTMEV
ncbi:hypothetical protein HIM_05069 [Hirsutella minnesotensis 3608]|uniref:IPT/TIG domain-containing protein n=1 Tax=Hirsutella minnesotensis 3608 TaxID=1043627 RepID=A0A0F7ZKT0_9HYPO|nr:hypothetical protein HIM_05069 [Hirsutella minnesotensis 3608]